jgi:nucleoside-diphosphate-sugar epimerase
MRVLVMGGSRFIGRHVCQKLLAHGSLKEPFPLYSSRHAIVDISGARTDLGYRSTPFREALRKTVSSIK